MGKLQVLDCEIKTENVNQWEKLYNPNFKPLEFEGFKKLLSACLLILIAQSSVSQTEAQLLLNEIYASPPTGINEWLEIYNPTNQVISLKDWQVAENISGAIRNHELVDKSHEASIAAYGFWVLENNKITLNNAGDTIYLFNPAGEQVDVITYPRLTSAQSYGRVVDGGNAWAILEPTRGMTNNIVLEEENEGQIAQVTTTGNTPTNSNSNSNNSSSSNSNNSSGTTSGNAGTQSNNAGAEQEAQSTSWQDGIRFKLPSYSYKTQESGSSRVGQVLGLATSSADLNKNNARATNNNNSVWLIVAFTAIIISLILIIFDWWLLWQGREEKNEKDDEF